ncbi:type III secretion system export apparatus subunit SctT [Qipengyuania sp. 6D47A]|uniref:Type III secretion system export apparatus subunit SctT n=2 Tax=Qipengyuania qiaonensis TaxID=2867240 RepID=A0ABS7J713_9SPHN|nr:type III secretion system export apparatus subunit SctT [Qipengyuania qiaonensis]MBX7482733.1 type III secretion system export apparatus subunit SctT [Qipengyuania qiaonensis]
MGQAVLIGLASARFAFAILFMPLFGRDTMPPLVRNSLIVTFGLIMLNAQAELIPRDLSAMDLLFIFAKEAGAGTVIGFFFATILWAMGVAGEIIDNKVGATMAQIVEPGSGSMASLTSNLLTRLAGVLFVTAGGMTLLVGTIMASYAIWPLGLGGLQFDPETVVLFEREFGRLFVLAFLFAAPVIVLLYLIDAGLGLLNRIAPQFNVFILSLPIKSMAASLILVMTLPLLGEAVLSDLSSRSETAEAVMELVGGSAEE